MAGATSGLGLFLLIISREQTQPSSLFWDFMVGTTRRGVGTHRTSQDQHQLTRMR